MNPRETEPSRNKNVTDGEPLADADDDELEDDDVDDEDDELENEEE